VAEEQKQTVFEPAKVIAVGIAAPLASLLTSRFGIAGTMLGLAIGSVILTVLVDALKVYLARASTKVIKVQSGLRTGVYHRGTRRRMGVLLSRFLYFPPRPLSPKRRRSILVGSLIAAGISFLVGLMIVTGVEASVGKSLSCWLWNECPTDESSSDGDSTSSTGTLPSIFGASPSASSDAPGVRPVDPQQQQPTPPGSPGSPSVPPSAAPSTQGWDSGAPAQGRDQSSPQEENHEQSPPVYSEEGQQQSSSNYMEEASQNDPQEEPQGEDRSSDSPSTGQNTREHDPYSVPWTT
jgi:hypothetical protein